MYAGGPGLHLRKGASGFTLEALAKAVQYTHEQGKKFYVTLNAFARNGDLDALPDLATAYQAMGVDGAIVDDLGVLSVCKKAAPRLPLHISTQANCVNYQTARMYHDLGASRVVLARELSLEKSPAYGPKHQPAKSWRRLCMGPCACLTPGAAFSAPI